MVFKIGDYYFDYYKFVKHCNDKILISAAPNIIRSDNNLNLNRPTKKIFSRLILFNIAATVGGKMRDYWYISASQQLQPHIHSPSLKTSKVTWSTQQMAKNLKQSV